ncbi:hypothetical protein DUNSADRAFT_2813 [Dunaliella salina]|uniref:Major facilitator superfamily (MFS) profile domain-containing protein n=1 Tax=Dunaliella salina TaxID=3046 RepID=A0ABQ7GV39_DUNSA|nr:hypothetical protein DUNSADRAFT_2813 [Dunaliella salina]|eukprot:KAF5838484.1 hypothetical protein DUNSADRAFT_2813 [Dunaliella salina]
MTKSMGVKEILGLDSVQGLTSDAKVLFANKVCRALAFGLSSVILAQYLSLIGLQDHSIGLLMTCTLLGDAAVSLLVTLTADWLGRRAMLLLGAVLKLIGALIFAAGSSDLWLLLLFGATVGVISPSGNEVGPFQTLEQSILSEQVGGAG